MFYNFFKKFSRFSLVALLLVAFIFPAQNSFAINEGVRNVTWNSSASRCNATDLKSDPVTPNEDIAWEITNPVCLAYFAAVGTTLSAAEYGSSLACGYSENIATVAAQMAIMVVLSPMTVVRRIQETSRCVLWSTTYPSCCFSTLGSSIAMAVALGQLAAIHSTAQGAYENARICGHDWHDWSKIDENGKEITTGTKWSRGMYGKSYQKCLLDLFTAPGGTNNCGLANRSLDITNKYYREYIYGGKEMQDDGDNQCSNPSTWNNDTRTKALGYTGNKQRYYMTGSGNASNYACYRFLSSDQTDKGAQAAYDCCLKRSQNTLCIESRTSFNGDNLSDFNGADPLNYKHKFCETGSRCNVGNVWYDTYASLKNPNYVCARTFSVCPYNHPLGGGTESKEYYDNKDLKNFCQVMNHCAKVPIPPYVRTSGLEGSFISSACRDLKGDTQNIYEHEVNLIITKNHNFSAPMAQCFKETMENMFLNKAGNTKCTDPIEFVNSNGECATGNYQYKVGEELSTPSFFIKIQNNLQSAIRMGLIISVTALGFSVLLGLSPLNKKQLIGYVLKLGLVVYFTLGTGWQDGFVRGVMGTSGYISDIMLRIDDQENDKQDGCQFPKFNYADENAATKFDNPAYPPGKEYLRIWDTLDCKLARAIGFTSGDPAPRLALMILGGFLTGGLGVIFLVASLSFAFFLFSIIVRALHIFILSTTSIIILLYISPITITLAMFARTKPIFDNWWKQILGFILQPVILFAYIGILITFFNIALVGDAKFSGGDNNTERQIICNEDAENTSIYCIFRVSEVKNFAGLEVIGIGLPILQNMNKVKVQAIIQAALMMFIFLTFLDKITDFAKELVGGDALSSNWKASMTGMMKSTYVALHAVQKRGNRGAMKGAAAAYGKAKEVTRALGAKNSESKKPDSTPD